MNWKPLCQYALGPANYLVDSSSISVECKATRIWQLLTLTFLHLLLPYSYYQNLNPPTMVSGVEDGIILFDANH